MKNTTVLDDIGERITRSGHDVAGTLGESAKAAGTTVGGAVAATYDDVLKRGRKARKKAAGQAKAQRKRGSKQLKQARKEFSHARDSVSGPAKRSRSHRGLVGLVVGILAAGAVTVVATRLLRSRAPDESDEY